MAARQSKRNTIAGLIEEIEAGRAEWDAAITGLRPTDYRAEVSRGWSIKDVLAHLATYLELNVRHLKAYKRRKRLASMRARNWYQFNKREAARNKKMTLAQARAAFTRFYKELLAELGTLTDEDLQAAFPSPWSANDTRQVKLATVLRADVSNHLREHARDVTKWKESRDAPG